MKELAAQPLRETATTNPAERASLVLPNMGGILLRHRKGLTATTAGMLALSWGGPGGAPVLSIDSVTSPTALSAPDFLRPGPLDALAAPNDNYPHIEFGEVFNTVLADASRECKKRRESELDKGQHYLAGDGKCKPPTTGPCVDQYPTPLRGYCRDVGFRIEYTSEPEVDKYTTIEERCHSILRSVIKRRVRKPTRHRYDVPVYVWRTMIDPFRSLPYICIFIDPRTGKPPNSAFSVSQRVTSSQGETTTGKSSGTPPQVTFQVSWGAGSTWRAFE